mmetsp:Transcript_68264/g.187108  ORF Transcript_68264/g.187108 Transcript_68264/m.187108 type:complete len:216 (+) Transcript_68264:443-1090(+)
MGFARARQRDGPAAARGGHVHVRPAHRAHDRARRPARRLRTPPRQRRVAREQLLQRHGRGQTLCSGQLAGDDRQRRLRGARGALARRALPAALHGWPGGGRHAVARQGPRYLCQPRVAGAAAAAADAVRGGADGFPHRERRRRVVRRRALAAGRRGARARRPDAGRAGQRRGGCALRRDGGACLAARGGARPQLSSASGAEPRARLVSGAAAPRP